jgi:hypothetical protein
MLPPELEPVTTYVAWGEAAEAVPEITPVFGSMLKPAGSAGLIV